MSVDTVLLTGASGFVAGFIARALLDAGYRVQGTVRDHAKAERVAAEFSAAGVDTNRLEFAVADLGDDAGWVEAASDCRFVVHTASPFPAHQPRNRYGLVPVAREGALRVIGAASRTGVERVVLTSSVAAVYYGREERPDYLFGEDDWTDTTKASVSAYPVSKTEAERAAWGAVADPCAPDLVSINPAFVLGPLMGEPTGTSAKLLHLMMTGRMPAVPDVAFGLIDVRDVARAHLRALEVPAAAGRRFLLSAGRRTLIEMARTIAESEPAYAGRVPRRTLPDWVVRAAALVASDARAAVPELGRRVRLDTAPASEVLGLTPRSPEAAIAAMARSLSEHHRSGSRS